MEIPDKHTPSPQQAERIVELRESFDRAPQIYDDARPSYPDEVIDWIIQKTGITVEQTLLEIGSGTGQATIKFAERGYRIHCIERGKNLAQLLLQKCERFKVSVDISSFEEWNPPPSFKTSLIFCATAFHWLDRNMKYKKCADLLTGNGYLVLLWNDVSVSQSLPITKAYDLVWKHYPEKRNAQKPQAETETERKLEIVNSGLFTLEDFLEYRWSFTQTRDNLMKGLFSLSLYLSLEPDKQKEIAAEVVNLFKDLDEMIATEIYTTVYIAKKK